MRLCLAVLRSLAASVLRSFFFRLTSIVLLRIHLSWAFVCVLYGVVLFRDYLTSGLLLEHHLLRIPLLFLMAVFYTQTVHVARTVTDYDPLTQLPNRQKLLSLANEALARARRSHETVGLLFLDLDGFKLINDTLGRHTGDQLLKAVAQRLTDGPAKTFSIARPGGDEFAILLDQVPSSQACSGLAEDILRSLETPFALAGREIFVSTSIGIALFPQDTQNAVHLLERAEAATSLAKEQGQNGYQFYFADIKAEAHQRLLVAQSLRKAIYKGELRTFYQPRVHLVTGEIIGLEALIRWEHPELGLVSPERFLATAETTGLIVPMGQWLLQEACSQVKCWQTRGGHAVRLSVNLSARELGQLDLVTLVSQLLKNLNFDPAFLEVEITETLLLHDTAVATEVLHSLKALGIHIALDDFGTGYSSLSYLKRFPIDALKVDQTFIRDLTTSADARAIVRAIIGMAHALKLQVVAEGVETEEQMTWLRDEGCVEGQGFAFSEALPADKIGALLREWPTRCWSPATSPRQLSFFPGITSPT